MHNYQMSIQQIRECQQIVSGMINQTQQASGMYQQMLQNEQQNAARLEELAQRERQATHMIEMALQGHQTAVQNMQHVMQICGQLEQYVHSTMNQLQSTQQMGYQQLQHGGYQPVLSQYQGASH